MRCSPSHWMRWDQTFPAEAARRAGGAFRSLSSADPTASSLAYPCQRCCRAFFRSDTTSGGRERSASSAQRRTRARFARLHGRQAPHRSDRRAVQSTSRQRDGSRSITLAAKPGGSSFDTQTNEDVVAGSHRNVGRTVGSERTRLRAVPQCSGSAPLVLPRRHLGPRSPER